MVVGVNGVGKTTTIGKLAFHFKKANRKVLLGAADTFRAAAVEQLIHLGRTGRCSDRKTADWVLILLLWLLTRLHPPRREMQMW